MRVFSEVASFYLSRFHPDFNQRFTPGAIRLLRLRRHASLKKARQELGYQPTSIREAINDAYAFHYNRPNAITNPDAKIPTENSKIATASTMNNKNLQATPQGGST